MRRVSGIAEGVVRRARVRARVDDDRGAIALLVAASLMVLIGLAALVVDRGLAADSQRQAQSAADASALAAAVELTRGGTVAAADAAARAYAVANYRVAAGDWAGCTAPLQPGYVAMNGTTCISHNPATKSVRVTLPSRQIPSAFGGIFGISTRTVVSAAAATYGNNGIADCVLCILGRLSGQTGGIQVVNGNVIGGQIEFNNANGSIEVTNGDIGYATSYEPTGTYRKDGSPVTPQEVTGFVNPYQGIALPPIGPAPPVSGSGTCTPGNYTDVGQCTTFAPGIYVVTEQNKNSELPVDAAGVMFFLTCSNPTTGRAEYCPSTGRSGGSFEAAGNKTLKLGGLNAPGSPYDRFAIFVDPNNTTQHKWAGKATLSVTGVVYAPNEDPNGGFSDRGNGQLTVIGRAVLGYLEMKGQGADKVHVNVTGPAPGGGKPAVVPTIPRLTQ